MHINIATENHVVGYESGAYEKYKSVRKDLKIKEYKFIDSEYWPSGDKIEYFAKGEDIYTIRHLAV